MAKDYARIYVAKLFEKLTGEIARSACLVSCMLSMKQSTSVRSVQDPIRGG